MLLAASSYLKSNFLILNEGYRTKRTCGYVLDRQSNALLIGETCLALPKLNLQFLTAHDYLLRNFNLFRLEATYEIREDVADVLQRIGAGRSAFFCNVHVSSAPLLLLPLSCSLLPPPPKFYVSSLHSALP